MPFIDDRLQWPDTFTEGPDGSLYISASHINESPPFTMESVRGRSRTASIASLPDLSNARPWKNERRAIAARLHVSPTNGGTIT
jgi:hypothetical protein